MINQLGSSRWRSFNPFARTQQVSAIENAIAQTVLACTEMSNSRTGVLIVFEREIYGSGDPLGAGRRCPHGYDRRRAREQRAFEEYLLRQGRDARWRSYHARRTAACRRVHAAAV